MTKNLKPSARFELEITDVNNYFTNNGTMEYRIIYCLWSDAGTFESLLRAGVLIQNHRKNKNTE